MIPEPQEQPNVSEDGGYVGRMVLFKARLRRKANWMANSQCPLTHGKSGRLVKVFVLDSGASIVAHGDNRSDDKLQTNLLDL